MPIRETITLERAQLKEILEKSEQRRQYLQDAGELYFLFFGTDGVPQQKWKIISKVTKIINNREVYEEKLSKFDTKYLEQLAKLILEDKEDN